MQPENVGGLVTAAATGDKASWTAIVERFSGLIWAVARSHRLGPADAEDVFQTTWLRLTEHIGRIDDPDRVGGWLATTARHEALRVLRARQRVRPVDDIEVADSADEVTPELSVVEAETAAERADRARRLWSAFETLPERCRQLLRVLMASPPPSYADVSAALGLPVGSIGPTRGRCLGQLRALLARREVTGPALAGEAP
jgi:RNA polymerase sigma factor (sigma-70 family)